MSNPCACTPQSCVGKGSSDFVLSISCSYQFNSYMNAAMLLLTQVQNSPTVVNVQALMLSMSLLYQYLTSSEITSQLTSADCIPNCVLNLLNTGTTLNNVLLKDLVCSANIVNGGTCPSVTPLTGEDAYVAALTNLTYLINIKGNDSNLLQIQKLWNSYGKILINSNGGNYISSICFHNICDVELFNSILALKNVLSTYNSNFTNSNLVTTSITNIADAVNSVITSYTQSQYTPYDSNDYSSANLDGPTRAFFTYINQPLLFGVGSIISGTPNYEGSSLVELSSAIAVTAFQTYLPMVGENTTCGGDLNALIGVVLSQMFGTNIFHSDCGQKCSSENHHCSLPLQNVSNEQQCSCSPGAPIPCCTPNPYACCNTNPQTCACKRFTANCPQVSGSSAAACPCSGYIS